MRLQRSHTERRRRTVSSFVAVTGTPSTEPSRSARLRKLRSSSCVSVNVMVAPCTWGWGLTAARTASSRAHCSGMPSSGSTQWAPTWRASQCAHSSTSRTSGADSSAVRLAKSSGQEPPMSAGTGRPHSTQVCRREATVMLLGEVEDEELGVRHAGDDEDVAGVDEAEGDGDVDAALPAEVGDGGAAQVGAQAVGVDAEAVVERGGDVELELALAVAGVQQLRVAGGHEALHALLVGLDGKAVGARLGLGAHGGSGGGHGDVRADEQVLLDRARGGRGGPERARSSR